MAILKYKGSNQKRKDFSPQMIPSLCQGFTGGSEHQPHVLWYFFFNTVKRLRSIYYFLIQRNKYEYEGKCVGIAIILKKELSN